MRVRLPAWLDGGDICENPSDSASRILHLTPSFFFFFNDTATTEIYTLSLHDALPIFQSRPPGTVFRALLFAGRNPRRDRSRHPRRTPVPCPALVPSRPNRRHRPRPPQRSEEHTSELQSHLNLVCRLLLEKKKKNARRRSGTSFDSTRISIKNSRKIRGDDHALWNKYTKRCDTHPHKAAPQDEARTDAAG